MTFLVLRRDERLSRSGVTVAGLVVVGLFVNDDRLVAWAGVWNALAIAIFASDLHRVSWALSSLLLTMVTHDDVVGLDELDDVSVSSGVEIVTRELVRIATVSVRCWCTLCTAA